jgi:4-diphosphocytidyl-2-C-methyl-D-erythritol kinase
MDKIQVESPAKINIGLNVIEKRPDGYHNLETIFYPLILSDRLYFEKSTSLELSTDSKTLNNVKDNLVLKAINVLVKLRGIELTVRVKIEKQIPIGGGLGGGSSNAAATLKAVNKLFDLKLINEELKSLALELGSDVPFFLNPLPSFAESRGEKLIPINIDIRYPILIVNPGINISTKWAFEKIIPSKPKESLRGLTRLNKVDFDLLKLVVSNDFEPIVFKEYPELEMIKTKLYELGASFALMSGTGSTVYGIFSNLQKAYWASDFFAQKYFTYLNNPFEKAAIT